MSDSQPQGHKRERRRVLLLGPDSGALARLNAILEAAGYWPWIETDAAAAAESLAPLRPAAAVVELPRQGHAPTLPECLRLIRQAQALQPAPPVLIVAGEDRMEEADALVRFGAREMVSVSLAPQELLRRLQSALPASGRGEAPSGEDAQPRLDFDSGAGGAAPELLVPRLLTGRSPAIREVFEQIRLVAPKNTTVVISGETGTGKERVARAIHRLSGRSPRALVSVNCGGIPAQLLEDEFFGHVKGAFTDAHQDRVGRFEQAHEGTIFLDEIGDLPLELQPKLLRVLQEREIHRIGGLETIHVDTRVIAASNVDLWSRVAEGRFREDLFYRIHVFPIHLPPLRERREDIPLFVEHFLDRFCRRDGLASKRLDPAAEEELLRRDWPGNIRELENAVEMAVVRAQHRPVVRVSDFPDPRPPGPVPAPSAAEDGASFRETVVRFERSLISRVLRKTGGNKTKAAELLRMKRTTLIEKVRRLGIEEDFSR